MLGPWSRGFMSLGNTEKNLYTGCDVPDVDYSEKWCPLSFEIRTVHPRAVKYALTRNHTVLFIISSSMHHVFNFLALFRSVRANLRRSAHEKCELLEDEGATSANESRITCCMIKTIMYHMAIEASWKSSIGLRWDEPVVDDSLTPSFCAESLTCLSIYFGSRFWSSDHRGDCISNGAAVGWPWDDGHRGLYPAATMIT